MDDQALEALTATGRGQSQVKALEYFERLKQSEDGWKVCGQAYTSGQYQSNDHVRFFCLQVIENYLKYGYKLSTLEDHQYMRTLILTCLQLQGKNEMQDKNFIKNKIAQVVSLAFVLDYPQHWPSFFAELLQTLNLGPVAIDMYLRICLAIDGEVVDREIIHTDQEIVRNTFIKDTIREQCVSQLTDSWYQIMTSYQENHPEITCMCMEVVGKYISWVDIGLIANDKYVPLLLSFMKMPLLRESACDCIHEILGKGMEPVAKMKLVESFTNVLESTGVFSPSQDEDADYLAKLSKLVNGIGINLTGSWQKLVKSKEMDSAAVTLQALENKVPLMFRFLGDEDDDVSGAVTTFAQEYIAVLKQIKPLSSKQRENIEGLLCVVINKMKYDTSYSFEQEGEDEAMFQDYRKQMKTIFNNLAQLDGELILVTVHGIITRTLMQWEGMPLSDVEMAISLMYMIGEALPASNGQHFTGDLNKATALQEMLRLLITSRVSCNGHMAVVLQFFETVVRYDKFFTCEPQHIPDVLVAFMDERGFRHRAAHVRSRAAYLFSRFIKSLRVHMQTYVEDVLKRMQDLLIFNTPDNGCGLLSNADQLFMYEIAGSLVVSSNLPNEKKHLYIQQLLSPVVTKFEEMLNKLIVESDPKKQLSYAQAINNAMALASRVSKGFSSQQTMQQYNCTQTFTEALKIFIQAVNVPVHRQLIQVGIRQYLHRMVVCLEKEILPFVPMVLENLLKQPDAKELHDFIPLMNQLIMKFKSAITPFLQEVFMPLVSTIYQVLNSPSDALDPNAADDKKMLQRSYFLFLSTIVTNDVVDVLKNQETQNLQNVLITIVQGAVDVPDPQAQKMCFLVMRRLVETWGGEDGGFVEFIYKSIIPACFLAPMKPTFDLRDGQSSLAIGECALCLKCILDKKGDEMITYLQSEYLPTLNLSPELSQEICQVMKSEIKVFRNYLKNFFAKAKS